jgi:phage tail-like protein
MSNSSSPTVSLLNYDYPVNFYFDVYCNNEVIAFQEVSGISQEMALEEVACGGENSFKYRLPVAASSRNITLKGAILPQNSKFNNWCLSTLSGSLSQPITPVSLLISLLNANGDVCLSWMFFDAYPVKYSVADLNSQNGSVLIQTIEMAYTYFTVSTNKIAYPTPTPDFDLKK